MPVSKKKANRLGDRLRHAQTPSTEDLAKLGEFRDDYLEAMAAVFFGIARLAFPRLALSARQKNAQTIIEKLRSALAGDAMALWRMQDIGGVRVIVEGRLQQDDAVEAIQREFSSRVYSLLETPHAGYRAIHAVVVAHGKSIEVQVRTALQNRWAQAYERLGDHWGRQIRRCEPPDDPDREHDVRGAKLSRAEIVRYMREDVSLEIAEAEGLERRVAAIRRRFPAILDLPAAASLARELEQLERFARMRLADAAAMIEALRDLKEMVPASVDHEAMIHHCQEGGALHYLVGYQRKTGRLVVAHPCKDRHEVVAQRRTLEEQHRQDSDFEVVLLSSGSPEELRRTHARYFEGVVELVEEAPAVPPAH